MPFLSTAGFLICRATARLLVQSRSAESTAPATQEDHRPTAAHGGQPSQGNIIKYCACHAEQHRTAESTAPATRNSIGVRLPRKNCPRRPTPSPGDIKYCACYAKQHRIAESIAPATRNSIGVQKVLRLHAKQHRSAESIAHEDRRPAAAHGGHPSQGIIQYYACRAKASECREYCACHARRPPPHGGPQPPTFAR